MKSAAFFLFLLIVFNSAVADTPARVLTLGTNVSSAYTAERSQLVRGGSIEHIDCILQTIQDRKSTRLNSSHVKISYAVFCLKKKTGCWYCRSWRATC